MRDIKTHGTLAREGKLVSVARDRHNPNRRASASGDALPGSWDGTVSRFAPRRPSLARSAPGLSTLYLAEKIARQRLEAAQSDIEDMQRFAEEGIAGAAGELERMRERLVKLSKTG